MGGHYLPVRDACCGATVAESGRASREGRAICMDVPMHKTRAFFPSRWERLKWEGAFTDPVLNLAWYRVQATLELPEERRKNETK